MLDYESNTNSSMEDQLSELRFENGVLRRNVFDLQDSLNKAYKKIDELNERMDKLCKTMTPSILANLPIGNPSQDTDSKINLPDCLEKVNFVHK